MNVLFATDHSAPAREAAWLLARLPFPKPHTLRLLTVVGLPSMPSAVGMHPAWPRILQDLQQEAYRDNDDLLKQFEGLDADVDAVVRRGDAAEQILDEASGAPNDLVVLGAVGHSALERMTLGSVSDSVATHAKCSVLVARPTGLASDENRPIRILIATDGSEPSNRTIEQMRQFAWGDNTEITLLHVMHSLESYQYEGADLVSEAWETERRRAQDELSARAAQFRRNGSLVTPEVRTAVHAGEEICQRAKSLHADMIVLGDRGHGAIQRFVLGSVSRYVLRHSNASVWICR